MITFVPAGGLGNRMKSIAAAIRLAKAVDDELEVIWFQDWGLGCRFDQLFKPLGIDRVILREANNIDLWTRDIPRKKNFYIPWIAERLHYQASMDRIKASKAFYEGFDFVSWARGRNVWLASDVYFIAQDISDDAFDIFHPVDHLQERIRQVTAGFGEGTTGVHIRRTDNVRATLLSPTSLFIERMKQEPDTQRFYLATDSENVKAEMKQIFGDRIITPSDKAERGSLAGMENALVEMYSLAATSRIIGTVASTYSMTAAAIGKIQLEVLEAETNDLNL